MKKTIEITTTQNVTIEYELALLRERMLAWLIDAFLVFFVAYLFLGVIIQTFSETFENERGWLMALVLLPVLAYFCYNIFFEIGRTGQTLGKMAMSIKVVRLDGKDPDWSDVLLRVILHLADTLFCAGVVGILLIKTTGKSQRLGDMAANTTVIKIQGSAFRFRLQDILNISSLDNYEPVFPQVRNLAERDMIFIKNTLQRFQKYPNRAHEEAIEDLVTHLMPILRVEQRPLNRLEFLKTLLRDYIVLTR